MARREYARIGTDMPDEPSVRALSVGAQWLYDRLLLSPELSRCGVLPLRIALWSDRAPDASQKKVGLWLAELIDRRHVTVDERYAEVLVRTYVRHDGLLGQPNVVAAMVSDCRVIASPTVRLAFLTELRRLWDLPDLTPGERGGWLLAHGHYPAPKTDSGNWPTVLPADSLARLRKSIGAGLYRYMADALAEGQVRAFDEATPHGIPEPFTRTPYAGAIAVSAVSVSVSVSERRDRAPQPGGSEDPEPPAGGSSDPTGQALLDTHQAQLGDLPATTVRGLTRHATAALASGTPAQQVLAGLEEWRRRPDAKPGLLPHLIGDVQRTAGDAAALDDPLAHPDAIAFLAEHPKEPVS